MSIQIIYIFDIYVYEEDLALNNLQGLICHKTKRNENKPNGCMQESNMTRKTKRKKIVSFSSELGFLRTKTIDYTCQGIYGLNITVQSFTEDY